MFIAWFALSTFALGQKNDFSLSVSAVATSDQQIRPLFGATSGPITHSTSTGVAFEGAYTRRIFDFHAASIGVEFPILGVPDRDVTPRVVGLPPFLSFSQSSLFFTPSAQVRFLPSGRVSPFLSLGGGLVHAKEPGNSVTRGALQFGGGVDFKTPLPHLAIRGEVRDFRARAFAQSSVGFRITPERLQNVFAGAGVVFRF
jgi:hypothetical protein